MWIRPSARGFRSVLFSIDPRTLGALRISLALLLLVDLCRRIPDLGVFYTDRGLLPSGLVRGTSPSFFFGLPTPPWAALGFVACGLVSLWLLVGWKTRAAQVLALVCSTSLHARVLPLTNGG